MKPKRILFLEDNLDGTVGGSYFCLLEIVKVIDRSRFEPYVVFYRNNTLIPEFEKYCPVAILSKKRGLVLADRLGRLGNMRNGNRPTHPFLLFLQRTYNFNRYTLPLFSRVIRILSTYAIDLVHLNNTPSELTWLVASKVLGLRCVAHLRSNWDPKPSQKLLLKHFDGIISISGSVTAHARKKGAYTGHFITIHDGIDVASVLTERKGTVDKVRMEFDPSKSCKFFVGVIGNLKEWKGQHVAIEATGILRRRYPDIRCVIVGNVSDLEEDRRYFELLKEMVVKRSLSENVVFTGYRKDIPDIMSALDVIVLPSIAPEPFGRVVLEAMALSRPVIATAHGGPLDIIEDNRSGFLTRPGDPKHLAEKIEYLLTHPHIAEGIGARARERVEGCFGIEMNVSRIERLYSALLTG